MRPLLGVLPPPVPLPLALAHARHPSLDWQDSRDCDDSDEFIIISELSSAPAIAHTSPRIVCVFRSDAFAMFVRNNDHSAVLSLPSVVRRRHFRRCDIGSSILIWYCDGHKWIGDPRSHVACCIVHSSLSRSKPFCLQAQISLAVPRICAL